MTIDIFAFFHSAECRFLDSIKTGDCTSFLHELQEAYVSIEQMIKAADIGQSEAIRIAQIARRLRIFAIHILDITVQGQILVNGVKAEASRIIEPRGVQEPDASGQSMQLQHGDSLNSKHLRHWFLEHIGDPFPSTSIKQSLVEETNAMISKLEAQGRIPISGPQSSHSAITYEQCQLWFINTRRRSQWTQFFRIFAHSDKCRMQKIANVISNDENEPDHRVNERLKSILDFNEQEGRSATAAGIQEHVQNCREAWSNMIGFLEHRIKEQPGDWLDTAIQDAKAEYERSRAHIRGERIRVHEHQITGHPPQSLEAQQRKAKQTSGRHQRRKPSKAAVRTCKESNAVSSMPAYRAKHTLARRSERTVSSSSDSSKENVAITTQQQRVSWNSAQFMSMPPPQSPLEAYSRPVQGALESARSSGWSFPEHTSFSDMQGSWGQTAFAIPSPSWESYVAQQ